MSFIILVVAIAIGSGVQGELQELNCQSEPFRQCQPARQVDPQDLEEKTFPGEAFFNKYCDVIVPSINCVKDYLEQCIENKEPNVVFMEMGLDIFIDMCDQDSVIRRVYLENVDCLNEIVPKLSECTSNSSRITRNFMTYLEAVDIDDDELTVIHDCANWLFSGGCMLMQIASKCNSDFAASLDSALKPYESKIEGFCTEELMNKIMPHFVDYMKKDSVENFLDFFEIGS